ncbi:DUF4349 domain-containing protein [Mucilaginibacter sp. OK283]|uniref:DUF4349 domain-containing protein n=1 Tax=Mucilaginibacter sp. OK283 TaxID=1881049 RepID=UPI0008B51FB0|nr:DUF4349 domain-containing protein [Mucilaginibacter sp. OK283]SEP29248.1 protein of unknown function [Mucilaginibacter sp. OK283]
MKTKIFTALAAGVLLLGACKGSGGSYDNEKSTNSADTASVSPAAVTAKTDKLDDAKLVKTADMRIKVKDVGKATETVTALTAKYGGMVIHHQMQTTNEGSQDLSVGNDSMMHISSFSSVADMTVNVPPNHLEDFMNQVAQIGLYVENRKMNIEDKSLDYLSSKLKRENRENAVKQEANTGEKIDPEKQLTAKDDIVDRKIANLKTDQDVKFSTVILSFYQSRTVLKEVLPSNDASAYQLPASKRLVSALIYGWSLFINLAVGFANIWVFVLAAICLWLLFRYYRRKHPAFFGTIKS